MTSFASLLSKKLFLLPLKKSYQLFLLTLNSQKLLLEKLCDLRDAIPSNWSLCFLLLPCHLHDTMPCQWSSSDLPQVLQIWESLFYSQVIFTLLSFLLVSRPPWGRQFNLKLAGLHIDLRNIAPAQLFVWITTLHKKGYSGRFI